ncbi:MAG: phage holin family protein [Muribaculaceae bacterium]|nr:phage holin family protein [Bacteroidales bacterium]MBD5303640.1 phage holin family protein [Bacteroides sp.]MDE6071222.1 phage holin family protein [Muribaculaceae bacterium]
MKEKLTDEIKDLLMQGKEWARLEVEYAKLTFAEKVTVLMSTLIIGAICLLMGMVVLIMLAFSLVELFKLMMAPALAYLTVAGIICVLALAIYLLRRPLMLNPIARFLTRLIISK